MGTKAKTLNADQELEKLVDNITRLLMKRAHESPSCTDWETFKRAIAAEQASIAFLNCFYQLVHERLDQKQLEALEREAHVRPNNREIFYHVAQVSMDPQQLQALEREARMLVNDERYFRWMSLPYNFTKDDVALR